MFAKVAAALEVRCLNCHSSETRMPLYASLPIAGGIIESDIEEGRHYMDIMEAFLPPEGMPVSEVALAKLEYVLQTDSMPPDWYVFMHWDGAVTDGERVRISDWIRDVRVRYYAPVGFSEDVVERPIHPLPPPRGGHADKVAIGRRLFHDVRLSTDDTVSCASCHALYKAGVDRSPFPTGIGGTPGVRNTPTIYNSAFQFSHSWDGWAGDLVKQTVGCITDPSRMASRLESITGKLQGDVSLTGEFEAVFADGWSMVNVADAIEAFVRTLTTPGSRFDRYLTEDNGSLSPEEEQGYGLFMDHGCWTCHVGKAMGGQSFEEMGRKVPFKTRSSDGREPDPGRFLVTGDEDDRGRFKVPTLRNVALTWPYMHDGSVGSMEEAVKVMSVCQTGETLSESETGHMVEFLKTLTGEYMGKTLR